MVRVKGPVGSLIANVTELGLAETPVRWNPTYSRLKVTVNAFGQGEAEAQQMALAASVSFPLVDFDPVILNELIRLSTAGAGSVGQNPRAGQRFGNNAALYAANCYYWTLGLSSPVAALPFTFLACKLADNPLDWPTGAERSVVPVNVEAISYSPDRSSLAGVVCWNNQLLS